jgi:predicted small lipoprotein YifL
MSLPRLLLLLGLVALCAGCGRRGALEAPQAAVPSAARTTAPAGQSPAAAGAAEDEDPALPPTLDVPGVAQPSRQSSGKGRKSYTVPPGPFPLDPIL